MGIAVGKKVVYFEGSLVSWHADTSLYYTCTGCFSDFRVVDKLISFSVNGNLPIGNYELVMVQTEGKVAVLRNVSVRGVSFSINSNSLVSGSADSIDFVRS